VAATRSECNPGGFDPNKAAVGSMPSPDWRRTPMIVVEWIAPVRNSAWVAACFGMCDQ